MCICYVGSSTVNNIEQVFNFIIILLQTVPRLVDATVLEGKKAKMASSGARHSAILTGKMSYQLLVSGYVRST